jgi:hypothetical protein
VLKHEQRTDTDKIMIKHILCKRCGFIKILLASRDRMQSIEQYTKTKRENKIKIGNKGVQRDSDN